MLDREPQFDLDHVFTYHPPQIGDEERYQAIRTAGKNLAAVIIATTPEGADQADAIRKVREAVMTANAAVATRGRLRREPMSFDCKTTERR